MRLMYERETRDEVKLNHIIKAVEAILMILSSLLTGINKSFPSYLRNK